MSLCLVAGVKQKKLWQCLVTLHIEHTYKTTLVSYCTSPSMKNSGKTGQYLKNINYKDDLCFLITTNNDACS